MNEFAYIDGFDVVNHDEDGITEVQRQPGDEVLILRADGSQWLIDCVTVEEWLEYKHNPTTEALRHLIGKHGRPRRVG